MYAKNQIKKKKVNNTMLVCFRLLLFIILDYTVIKKQVFNNTLKVHKLNLTQTQF